MPSIRHWQLRPPDLWTPDDARDYIVDTTATLTGSMRPVLSAIGPLQTVNILLTMVYHIAKANPVWSDHIVTSLDEVADGIVKMMPTRAEATKH